MKSSILAILSFVLAASADPIVVPTQTSLSSEDLQKPFLKQELPDAKQGFFYVNFVASENDLSQISSPLPGLGVGYRRLVGDGAADISFSGIGRNEGKKSKYFWTAPKASYLHYLQPDAEKSAYIGGGLAWGGVRTSDSDFVGIIPSATVGYEFMHRNAALGFLELNMSQPAIAVKNLESFPKPISEVTVGFGF